MLLGHPSVQTTDRNLGSKQNLIHAPNGAIGLRVPSNLVWRLVLLERPL